MAELICIRQPGGALLPATDEDAEALQKIKAGAAVRVEVKQIRNYKFLQKWITLVRYAFNLWSETMAPMEYKGHPVAPEFNRFRKELTIMCGYFHVVYSINGKFRLEADSISFANMSEEVFERLYSKTIDVILAKILGGTGMTEVQLRGHVDHILRYS